MLRQCPNCYSTKYAKILYGLPADMRELESAIERKEIVLGGCTVTGNDPTWKCDTCGHKWNGKVANSYQY